MVKPKSTQADTSADEAQASEGPADIVPATYPRRNPENLAKFGAEVLDIIEASEQRIAAEKAGRAGSVHVRPKRKHTIRQSDVEAVSARLVQAGYALLAIRKIAMDASESDDDGFYAVAIQELARSSVKGIDACIERLTGGPGMGNFASEFD